MSGKFTNKEQIKTFEMSDPNQKKQRQGRANQRQIDALIDYLEINPNVATGKFNSLHGKSDYDNSWAELSRDLNALANDGKTKDVKSWKTTWRDIKSKISDKVQKLRKARAQTGNNPVEDFLTEQEKRVLGIIGHEYVEGIGTVPDSFPEEFENVMDELFEGHEDILGEPPININVAPATSSTLIVPKCNNRITNEKALIRKRRLIKPTAKSATSIPIEGGTQKIIAQSARDENNEMEDSTDNENEPDEITPQKRTRPKRVRRERLGVQFADAREVFQRIAENQTKAMMMIGEAMKQMAEATVRVSHAVEKLAAVEEKQTEMFSLLR